MSAENPAPNDQEQKRRQRIVESNEILTSIRQDAIELLGDPDEVIKINPLRRIVNAMSNVSRYQYQTTLATEEPRPAGNIKKVIGYIEDEQGERTRAEVTTDSPFPLVITGDIYVRVAGKDEYLSISSRYAEVIKNDRSPFYTHPILGNTFEGQKKRAASLEDAREWRSVVDSVTEHRGEIPESPTPILDYGFWFEII